MISDRNGIGNSCRTFFLLVLCFLTLSLFTSNLANAQLLPPKNSDDFYGSFTPKVDLSKIGLVRCSYDGEFEMHLSKVYDDLPKAIEKSFEDPLDCVLKHPSEFSAFIDERVTENVGDIYTLAPLDYSDVEYKKIGRFSLLDEGDEGDKRVGAILDKGDQERCYDWSILLSGTLELKMRMPILRDIGEFDWRYKEAKRLIEAEGGYRNISECKEFPIKENLRPGIYMLSEDLEGNVYSNMFFDVMDLALLSISSGIIDTANPEICGAVTGGHEYILPDIDGDGYNELLNTYGDFAELYKFQPALSEKTNMYDLILVTAFY
jgi:hypothetical protein